MRHLYPAISPYHTEYVCCDNHQIYVEHLGNPEGLPVLYLHGGPGGGISSVSKRYFDPERYHIIVFDQRGCGKSQPTLSLDNNTTPHLISDIETIRNACGIEQWVVSGGSWGTTLALLYAIEFPHRVMSLLLRGIFLARKQDYDWFLSPNGGAAQVYPEHYQDFISHLQAPASCHDVIEQYQSIFDTSCELSQLMAAKAWCQWEHQLAYIHPPEFNVPESSVQECLSLATLECRYIAAHCYIEENDIIKRRDALRHIPTTVIHGRFDMVCKLSGAYELTQGWESARLMVVPGAGHSGDDAKIAAAMTQAADALAQFLKDSSQ